MTRNEILKTIENRKEVYTNVSEYNREFKRYDDFILSYEKKIVCVEILRLFTEYTTIEEFLKNLHTIANKEWDDLQECEKIFCEEDIRTNITRTRWAIIIDIIERIEE